jgi:hypothetical protein
MDPIARADSIVQQLRTGQAACGLCNPKAWTCFMDAVLQLLILSPEFVKDVLVHCFEHHT